MEELIEHIDECGKILGIVNRNVAHKKGLLHRVVHICLINSKNEILLQKRSKNKKLYPNVWDISAAGHVDVAESAIDAAVRETAEELGLILKKEDFEFAFSFLDDLSVGGFKIVELADVFIVKKDIDIKQVKTQEAEVDEVKWLSFEEFSKTCMSSVFCPHKKGFEKLIKWLKPC